MSAMLAIFKALSDGNRLKIFAALTHIDELCACQINEFLQVSGATASRHMSIMASAGLVESRKDGRWVYYRLHHNRTPFNELLHYIQTNLATDQEFKADIKVLNALLQCTPEEICRKQRGEMCCPKPM
jgi:ArsR family transcriptional regulator, arsenate/arsenite/antimonite-responsive transcriptional repressor